MISCNLLPLYRAKRERVTSWIKFCAPLLVPAVLFGACSAPLRADGLSAYLPLNLEPETERQIERVLILANVPILKRPIPVELVKLALPQACTVDKYLCKKVTRYLERYSRDYALTHAGATAAFTHGATTVLPNAYGMDSDSHYEFSAQGFVQPSRYLLATAGVVSYEGRTQPAGTALSLGFDWAQIDLGYRDHWMSPMTDSSMIMSTEAPTTPSVTLSNYAPLTRLGFQYEFFLTRLDQTGTGSPSGDNILYNGVLSRGNPRLFGAQFSIEPVSRLVSRRQSIAGVRGRERPAGFGRFPGTRFLQAERPVPDPGQPRGVLRQPLRVSGEDAVRRLCPIRRRGQLRWRQLPARQRSAGGRHRLPQGLAALRLDLRNHRMAEHLVRPQHLSGRHDEQRARARQLGRGSASVQRRRRRSHPDAARRLDASVRRLLAGAGAYAREPGVLRRGFPAISRREIHPPSPTIIISMRR